MLVDSGLDLGLLIFWEGFMEFQWKDLLEKKPGVTKMQNFVWLENSKQHPILNLVSPSISMYWKAYKSFMLSIRVFLLCSFYKLFNKMPIYKHQSSFLFFFCFLFLLASFFFFSLFLFALLPSWFCCVIITYACGWITCKDVRVFNQKVKD